MENFDQSKFTCLNKEYLFEITNVLYTLSGHIRGFEGFVSKPNELQFEMIWDGQGKSLSKDSGFDLVIREKLVEKKLKLNEKTKKQN